MMKYIKYNLRTSAIPRQPRFSSIRDLFHFGTAVFGLMYLPPGYDCSNSCLTLLGIFVFIIGTDILITL